MKHFTLKNISALKSLGGTSLHWQPGSCILISYSQYLSERKTTNGDIKCWTFSSIQCRLKT